MEEGKGPVCVTGGTGFIASWLIMKLLQSGYSVHTTFRFHPENKKDISYLTSLPKASNNLKIFNADLTKPESFTEAIKGCTGVFHLAHPENTNGSLSTETVTKIALEGTLSILRACLESKTVKRVVYTSSSITVIPKDNDQGLIDETTWTDVTMFESDNNTKGSSYVVAKTKTERAVWEFVEKHGLDVVSVIPPIVFGPFICPWFPNTVQMGLALIMGKQEYYRVLCKGNIVHVDDLASAHIFLFELPEAKGRYICSSNEITIQGLAQFLSARYPQYQIPNSETLDKVEEGYKAPSLSSKKLLNSGFRFKYGLDGMFDEAIQCCKEKGYLS